MWQSYKDGKLSWRKSYTDKYTVKKIKCVAKNKTGATLKIVKKKIQELFFK